MDKKKKKKNYAFLEKSYSWASTTKQMKTGGTDSIQHISALKYLGTIQFK